MTAFGGRALRLPKVLEPAAHAYRVQYAIRTILRDRLTNEGAFKNCFEMEDGDRVICAILRRSFRNPTLRAALTRSHLVNVGDWLLQHPELSERYYYPADTTKGAGSSRTPA